MQKLLSAGIITLILLIITSAGFKINTETSDAVSERLSKTIELVNNGENEKARREMKKCVDIWNSHFQKMQIFISHGRIDEIDESLKTAEYQLNGNNDTEFITEASRSLVLLEHFKDMEYPSVYNIF